MSGLTSLETLIVFNKILEPEMQDRPDVCLGSLDFVRRKFILAESYEELELIRDALQQSSIIRTVSSSSLSPSVTGSSSITQTEAESSARDTSSSAIAPVTGGGTSSTASIGGQSRTADSINLATSLTNAMFASQVPLPTTATVFVTDEIRLDDALIQAGPPFAMPRTESLPATRPSLLTSGASDFIPAQTTFSSLFPISSSTKQGPTNKPPGNVPATITVVEFVPMNANGASAISTVQVAGMATAGSLITVILVSLGLWVYWRRRAHVSGQK
ncbi:hypothetical protein HDU96_001075 [Phlyctochytrium bullatum]|nr:hypothetical protein HDU96_001075 [Phlyctochytrium bullatum]